MYISIYLYIYICVYLCPYITDAPEAKESLMKHTFIRNFLNLLMNQTY